MSDEKKDGINKKKKRSGKHKVDIPTIIFIVLIIVGLIVCTYLAFRKPKSVIYKKDYGDTVTVLVEFFYKSDEIDLAIDTEDGKTLQEGKYKTTDKENEYTATFDDGNGGELKVDIAIEDKSLTMTYEDGSEITFKETD